MSRDSKARRDAKKRRVPLKLSRREIIHNAIRAGERAARLGEPATIPERYRGDEGQRFAWFNAYNQVKGGAP